MPLAEGGTCGDVEPTHPLGRDANESLNCQLEEACFVFSVPKISVEMEEFLPGVTLLVHWSLLTSLILDFFRDISPKKSCGWTISSVVEPELYYQNYWQSIGNQTQPSAGNLEPRPSSMSAKIFHQPSEETSRHSMILLGWIVMRLMSSYFIFKILL